MTVRHPRRPGGAAVRAGAAAAARTSLAATALAGSLLVSPLGALPAAAAADPGDGLWSYTATGVAEAHATTTGEGLTVAVLSGTINPAAPDLVGADVQASTTCYDADGTQRSPVSTGPDALVGTEATALIVGTGAGAAGQPGVRGVAPGASVLHVAVEGMAGIHGINGELFTCLPRTGEMGSHFFADAVDLAIEAGAKILVLPSRPALVFDDTEIDALLRAYEAGMVVVAEAEYSFIDEKVQEPATLNGVVSVSATDASGDLPAYFTPPRDRQLAVLAPGAVLRTPAVGAAGAWDAYALTAEVDRFGAPWTAGVLALAWSQHPDATANQMIQALVRTTAGAADDGELPRHDDEYGYGLVSVPRLLAVDPTTLPDENPLWHPVSDSGARPTTTQIHEATGYTEPTAEPTDDAAEDPAGPYDEDGDAGGSGASGFPLTPVLGGAAALLVAAAVAAVLVRRRATRRDT